MAAIRNRTQELISVKASQLRPNPRNWRSHPESQKKALDAILQEVGFVGATLVRRLPEPDEQGRIFELIDGHLRAEDAGDAELPCLVVDLNEAEADKILATFDPLGALAGQDDAALTALLASIECETPAMEALLKEVAEQYELPVTAPASQGDPDEVPEVPAVPTTEAGDLWLLGEHRLLCGDALKAEDVTYLMGDLRADLWLTDPPYNVAYVGKTKEAKTIQNDEMADDTFRLFLVESFEHAFAAMKPGASFYIWHADSEGYNFRGAIVDNSQEVRQCLVWAKNVMVMGRQDYQWRHEPALYGWKAGAAHGWYSDRCQTTLLNFDRPTSSQDHPTMKPVALFEYLIGNSTAPQGVVLDNFAGSGTTIIACEKLGRRSCSLELDPVYCDVIAERYFAFCGKMPVLEATGETFAQVKERRAAARPPAEALVERATS